MVFPKDGISQYIENTADYFPPANYQVLLSFYRSLQLESDPSASQFIPLSSVAQRGRNTKLFAVGILPPVQNVTGRLIDRTASLSVRDLTGVAPDTFLTDPHPDGNPEVLSPQLNTELDPARQRVINAAAGELGNSEWTRYVGVVEPRPPSQRVSWCGIFATWAMQEAGYNTHWELGKGIRPPMSTTQNPKPGDIAYFGGELHHYAIVESIEGNIINTIDGNSQGRKVARNSRPRSSIRAFFSLDSVDQGAPSNLSVPEEPNPVGYDTSTTLNWHGGGRRSAKEAAQSQAETEDVDIQFTEEGLKLLDRQRNMIRLAQDAARRMAQAPPLRFLVNPNKFSVKAQKIVSDGNWSRNGPIIEFWGDDQDKISGSGQVAAFYALDKNPLSGGGGGPGLTRNARNASQAWQNFQSLWLIYKNNGGLYLNHSDIGQSERDIVLSTVGSVYIYYDNILYIGAFDSFNVRETDTKPFTVEYDFEFSVRAAFLLELPADYNYSSKAAEFTDRNARGLPTRSTRQPESTVSRDSRVITARQALVDAQDEAAGTDTPGVRQANQQLFEANEQSRAENGGT